MQSTVDVRLVLLGDLQGGEPLRRSYDSAAIASTCDASTIVGYGTSDEGQEATIWMD